MSNYKIKIGIDYHGVIDKNPRRFRVFAKDMIKENVEVHIITGTRKKDFKHKIPYTHFHSVTDDFLKRKIPYHIDENGNPSFDNEIWDKAKAEYCKKHKIDLMIDDSDVYGKYFSTPYYQYR